jgi:hypothetical protein
MADPLTVKDAIAGLVATAAHVSKVFTKVMVDAPAIAKSAIIEVNAFSIAITAIQRLITELEAAANERSSLIELGHLLVTLTDAVLMFSDLKKAIDSIPQSRN